MVNGDYMAGLERFAKEKYSNQEGKPMPPPLTKTRPDSGSGSDGKFKNYVPTDKRAKSGKWSFFNGGGGGGGGPHNGGGGGGTCFTAPHQNTGSSNQKGKSSSHCDSGYSSNNSSSSGSFGVRRNSSFNLGTPHSQGESTGFRLGSGLDNYGGGSGDRNRHAASSGSGSSNGGHRSFGRSLSESSAGSTGSNGGLGGMSLSAIYEQEFGKKKK